MQDVGAVVQGRLLPELTSVVPGLGFADVHRKRAPVPRRAPSTEPTPSAPRSRKGALTRARLIDAAKQVFEETGFLDARISDIAERAGLSHGSFYHYFDSKEQVFREVAEAQEELLTAAGDDEPAPGEAGSTELDRIARANRRYLARYRDNGRIMSVIEEVSRYDTFVNEARMRRQKHFADRAEKGIRRLQEQGEADPGIDPRIAAVALGAMVARFAELWLGQEWDDFEFDEAVDQLSRLWANAIGVEVPAAATPRTAGRKRRAGTARRSA
jgi:AcrR family transcriptional regulator